MVVVVKSKDIVSAPWSFCQKHFFMILEWSLMNLKSFNNSNFSLIHFTMLFWKVQYQKSVPIPILHPSLRQKYSHFGTFVPVHRFQKFLWQNDFWLSIMRDLSHTFAKKCLRPCPGPFMSLSKRINWIISSFSFGFSKILFVLGSWDDSGRLGTRIGTGALFWYLNF